MADLVSGWEAEEGGASVLGLSLSLRCHLTRTRIRPCCARRYTGNKLPVGVPGGINTGVMLVDARKLARGYSLKRYWSEVTRIVGEGIYHSVHGKYYGSTDMPCEFAYRAVAS